VLAGGQNLNLAMVLMKKSVCKAFDAAKKKHCTFNLFRVPVVLKNYVHSDEHPSCVRADLRI
jgi:hypothetical protein